MTPAEFIKAILPAAQACQRDAGIPASVTIAQAAAETSWGTRVRGNNLFGIKADASWHGPVVRFSTHEEFDKGTKTAMVDGFRSYSSWNESVEDRARFLRSNRRYAPCFREKTPEGWARAIAAGGWATGSGYADLLIAVMKGRNLQQYDVPAVVKP